MINMILICNGISIGIKLQKMLVNTSEFGKFQASSQLDWSDTQQNAQFGALVVACLPSITIWMHQQKHNVELKSIKGQ